MPTFYHQHNALHFLILALGVIVLIQTIAKKQGDVVTDDCMLAENLGFKVKLVDCTNENIKLTTYDDLYVAEAILRLRRDRKAREKAENGGKK